MELVQSGLLRCGAEVGLKWEKRIDRRRQQGRRRGRWRRAEVEEEEEEEVGEEEEEQKRAVERYEYS